MQTFQQHWHKNYNKPTESHNKTNVATFHFRQSCPNLLARLEKKQAKPFSLSEFEVKRNR